jgi:hypothetical protein
MDRPLLLASALMLLACGSDGGTGVSRKECGAECEQNDAAFKDTMAETNATPASASAESKPEPTTEQPSLPAAGMGGESSSGGGALGSEGTTVAVEGGGGNATTTPVRDGGGDAVTTAPALDAGRRPDAGIVPDASDAGAASAASDAAGPSITSCPPANFSEGAPCNEEGFFCDSCEMTCCGDTCNGPTYHCTSGRWESSGPVDCTNQFGCSPFGGPGGSGGG